MTVRWFMAALSLGMLAFAQTAPAARSQGGGQRCELHVFPSRLSGVFNATTMPGSSGTLISDALSIKDPKIGERLMAEHLDEEAQVKILTGLNLPALLHIDADVIFEKHVAWDFDIRNYRKNPRLIAGAGSCYKELIVYSTYVEKGTLSKTFKTWLVYRSYGDGAAPIYAIDKAPSYGLHAFPPRSEGEINTGIEEVLAGYRQNVLTFVTTAVKRP